MRELDVPAELSDVRWENPVPEALRSLSLEDFWARFGELEASIEALRARLSPMKYSAMSGDIGLGWMCVRRRRSRRDLRLVSRTSPAGSCEWCG